MSRSGTDTTERIRASWLELGQGHPGLLLVLALLVGITGLANVVCVRLEEEDLAYPFVGVNLGGQGSGIADLQSDVAFPLRLERGHVGNDSAAGVGGFAHTDGQYVPRNAEVLDRAGQREAVGRHDAHITIEFHETAI